MDLSISLSTGNLEYLRKEVASGRFGAYSEVVEEALRLMQSLEQDDPDKLAWLRTAYEEGLASEDIGEIDFADLKREARERLSARKRGA